MIPIRTTTPTRYPTFDTDMPNEVLDLMKRYPHPVRQQSSGGFEYLPVPRPRDTVRGGT